MPQDGLAGLLSRSGFFSEAQMEKALQLQQKEKVSIAEAAARLSFAAEEAVIAALARILRVPVASRQNGLLPPRKDQNLEDLIPELLARKYRLLPLFKSGMRLAVAMENPTDLPALDELRFTTGLEMIPHIAAAKELETAIGEFYGTADAHAMLDLGSGRGSEKNCGPEISLPPALGSGGRGSPGPKDKTPGDPVNCTVFAPPQASPGESFLVQAFAHLPDLAAEALADATEFDEFAKRRGATALGTRIPRGSRLTFELASRGLRIHDPVSSTVWQGRTASVQFEAEVPADSPRETILSVISISQDSVPIGEIKFVLYVNRSPKACSREIKPTGDAARYQTAFISYASQDRPEVLRRIQMLAPAGIRFFQDVLDLEPGQRWSEEIFKRIDESDVLFLFWSTAAKNSEWVEKEWRYGLERRGVNFIKPVILEGPPVPAPPRDLAQIHFNDKVLYFINT